MRKTQVARTLALLRATAKAPTRKGAAMSTIAGDKLRPTDTFMRRHIGPKDADISQMLKSIENGKYKSLEALVADTVPPAILLPKNLELPPSMTESEALAALKAIAGKNKVLKSFIGQGYYETHTPTVILRNILENPGWYTSYTPYQAEISQGRLESLLNYQTMVADLTGMDISNASLLDEGTAAAEAMNLAFGQHNTKRIKFFVDQDCHPQTIDVVKTRAKAIDINVVVGDALSADFSNNEFCGVLYQYPSTKGAVLADGLQQLVDRAKESKTVVIAATDLLALTVIKSPGEIGADICVGSAQRFGVPLGYGGPHAGFLACRDDFKRRMPGRVIGVSIDSAGNRALRMAMQTREQHIRRDKATSNICTAQALLANMAAMYAVYHGPEGLKDIANRVHALASVFAGSLKEAGFTVNDGKDHDFFDTFVVNVNDANRVRQILERGVANGINFRKVDDATLGISVDERTTSEHLVKALDAFGVNTTAEKLSAAAGTLPSFSAAVARTSPILTHEVFNKHHSETQFLRYIHRLQAKDLSLTTSMISLGSCTMKLNATSEMIPITWSEFADIHPFAPADQATGFVEMISGLSDYLSRITGFASVSVQPNSGAAGEYAGLLAIRAYLESIDQGHRNVCLIPVSAHGTNPASAVMAGMKVVVVASDDKGNVDMEDLKKKVALHKDNLAAFMITYPSTYGVFEEGIKDIVSLIHENGGQIYMDGANMNAQVALTSPGTIGADVCHLNLHKTFCIPHGGGGPGVGAIGVASHLAPFLPGHPVVPVGGFGPGGKSTGVSGAGNTIAAAPFGSALILPIPWMYIRMLGEDGLKKATSTAILNANYLAARLSSHYNLLFAGRAGRNAHEFIIDIRPLKAASNGAITEEDVAKRLIDYGFHAPTMSWPVAGTLMIEPTESEDLGELNRFAEALISIRKEIQDVIDGRVDPKNNVLKNAPHTAHVVTSDEWDRPYTRQQAAFPAPWNKIHKFWPSVGRVDNVYGDRNLVCSCDPIESYMN